MWVPYSASILNYGSHKRHVTVFLNTMRTAGEESDNLAFAGIEGLHPVLFPLL